ncbi:MAG: hypothetical protein GX682_03125 [Clostridiaceae bacterium]|nr:hypothetical protein [Clostridiaceae bacterium]
MQRMSIDDRLELAANYGEMEMYLFLWKKTISRLEKGGLTIKKIYPSKRTGEYYCNISWEAVTYAKNQANTLYEIALEAKNKE